MARRRRVALIIETSSAYGRRILKGGPPVRPHASVVVDLPRTAVARRPAPAVAGRLGRRRDHLPGHDQATGRRRGEDQGPPDRPDRSPRDVRAPPGLVRRPGDRRDGRRAPDRARVPPLRLRRVRPGVVVAAPPGRVLDGGGEVRRRLSRLRVALVRQGRPPLGDRAGPDRGVAPGPPQADRDHGLQRPPGPARPGRLQPDRPGGPRGGRRHRRRRRGRDLRALRTRPCRASSPTPNSSVTRPPSCSTA